MKRLERIFVRANGWALSDTAGFFDERVLVTVGGRFQSVAVKNYSAASGQDGMLSGQPISGHRVSPVHGLVVKPLAWLSLYANHIEALQPGDAAPPTANNPGQRTPQGRNIKRAAKAHRHRHVVARRTTLQTVQHPQPLLAIRQHHPAITKMANTSAQRRTAIRRQTGKLNRQTRRARMVKQRTQRKAAAGPFP